MSKILSKIGKKKRIAGKKNRWEKSKIGSGLNSYIFHFILDMEARNMLATTRVLKMADGVS